MNLPLKRKKAEVGQKRKSTREQRMNSKNMALVVAALTASALIAPKLISKLGAAEVERAVSRIDGFELRHSGLESNELPLFGLEYAIWANYPYFTYRDETYVRAGAGGVTIRRDEKRATRYLVDEEVTSRDSRRMRTLASTIRIRDKEGGSVIASRSFHDGEVEDGTGWVGQHAANFVRRVLVPADAVGGPVGTKRYPLASAKLETLPVEPYAAGKSVIGCPRDYQVENLPSSRKLDTVSWRFLPQSPLASVACTSDHVVAFSLVYPTSIFVDVLSPAGEFLGQAEVRVPVPIEARLYRLDAVSSDPAVLAFDVSYAMRAVKEGRWVLEPYKRFRIRLPTPGKP